MRALWRGLCAAPKKRNRNFRAFGSKPDLTHGEGNSASDVQSACTTLLTMPVADRKPGLGTWQQIFHLECDIKPRRRTVVVTVSGE
ncbi:MAG: YjbQ family protein [Limisphaerales bacterium]